MMSHTFVWQCPYCQTTMHDEIDPIDGPFFSCTCDKCGNAFDQLDVEKESRS
jgi:hypothetical protein